jgi:hypothetical protein
MKYFFKHAIATRSISKDYQGQCNDRNSPVMEITKFFLEPFIDKQPESKEKKGGELQEGIHGYGIENLPINKKREKFSNS